MDRIRIVRSPQDVKPLVEKLKEVLVSDVTDNTDLSNAYIRGHIVGHSTTDDGSSLLLTLQGDGLQFTTVIRGEAANQYPDASTGGTLYLYGGSIDKSEPEWSQASGFQLVIDDITETNVILLHKNIKEPKRTGRRQVTEPSVTTSTAAETPPITALPSITPAVPAAPPPIITPSAIPHPSLSLPHAVTPPPPVRCPMLHTSWDEVEMTISREYTREGESEDGEPRCGSASPAIDRQGVEPGQRCRKRMAAEMDPTSDDEDNRQQGKRPGETKVTNRDTAVLPNLPKRSTVAPAKGGGDAGFDVGGSGAGGRNGFGSGAGGSGVGCRDGVGSGAGGRNVGGSGADGSGVGGSGVGGSGAGGSAGGCRDGVGSGAGGSGVGSIGGSGTGGRNGVGSVGGSGVGGRNGVGSVGGSGTGGNGVRGIDGVGSAGAREVGIAGVGSAGGSKGGYKYSKIAQLKSGDDKINVFGVVKFFKPIAQTKGTDFCSVLTIVDESSPVSGLKCVIFNRSQDKLPHIRSVGDVICLHRLKIQTFKDELQAMGRASPVPSASTASRTRRSFPGPALREWAEQHSELNSDTRARRLCDVSGGDYFDLTCQVVSKSVFASQDYTILSVWDGTKFPLEHKQYDYSYSETASDPGLSAAAGNLAVPVVLYDNHTMQGRAIRPAQFVRLSNVHATRLKGYSFAASDQQFYVELCIHKGTQYGSGATVLPDCDEGAVRLKSQLASLVGAGGRDEAAAPLQRWCPTSVRPLPRSATVTPYTRVAFTPIRDVLVYPTVPFKFNCRARVECVFPACVEDMVQLRCSRCARKVPMPRTSRADSDALTGTPCPTCVGDAAAGGAPTSAPTEAVLRLIYVFKLVLDDETGHLSAYVAEDDAATFLPGLPPTNLYVEQDSRRKLLDRLYYLTGGNDPFVEHPPGYRQQLPRPWMECCLKSYFHIQRAPGGVPSPRKVNYRVFDTILNSLEPEVEEVMEGGVLSDTHEDS
eukprot:Em0099g17a